MEASKKFSATEYFETQPAPPGLDDDVAKTRNFVTQQAKAKRKVALVTVRPPLVSLIWKAQIYFRAVGRLYPLRRMCELV
jgi:hypothetical protein